MRLAIDDFGTGYSSLAYLQHLPVDILKIEKSFVNNVTRGKSDTALARTIIALGNSFSLRTVAEGVEEEQQRSRLLTLGCGLAQGHLFAAPLTSQQVTMLLERGDSATQSEPRLPPDRVASH